MTVLRFNAFSNLNRFYSEDSSVYVADLYSISGLFTCRALELRDSASSSCDNSGVTYGCARLIKDCDNRRNRIRVSMETSSTRKHFSSQVLPNSIFSYLYGCRRSPRIKETSIPGDSRPAQTF